MSSALTGTHETLGSVRTDELRPAIARIRAAAGPLAGYAVAELGSAIDAALGRLPWGIVVDLRPLDAVSPAGLAMLMRVACAAGELDVGLTLVCPAVVRSALADAGLTEHFELSHDLDAALSTLGVVVRRLPSTRR